jgi:hypothetical protein
MTDARMAALEAVADAVRDYWLKSASHENFYAVGQALRALDALPAPAPAQGEGETVTLGLIRARLSGAWAATEQPEQEDPRDWVHVGNLTFTAPTPAPIPTIRATVEGGGE